MGPKPGDWTRAYFAALSSLGMVRRSADAAGVSYRMVKLRRKTDPAFAAEEKECLDEARASYEDEAIRRAVEGTAQEHFDRDGKLVSRKIEYDTTLLLRILGRLDPTWREKQSIEITEGAHMTRAEARAALDKARAEQAAHASRS